MSFDGGAPQKKGMGTGAKVLIVLGILAGVGVLACCGGAAFFGYKAQPKISTVPAEVAAQSTAIIPMEIDESKWVGKNSIEQDVIFMKWTYCVWDEKDGDGGISVLGMTVPQGAQQQPGQSPDQAIEQAFSQNPDISSLVKLKETTSTTKTVTMMGAEQEFTFIEGQRPNSDVEWVEWSGSINKPGGQIINIRVQIEKEKYDEQEIIDMLESAK